MGDVEDRCLTMMLRLRAQTMVQLHKLGFNESPEELMKTPETAQIVDDVISRIWSDYFAKEGLDVASIKSTSDLPDEMENMLKFMEQQVQVAESNTSMIWLHSLNLCATHQVLRVLVPDENAAAQMQHLLPQADMVTIIPTTGTDWIKRMPQETKDGLTTVVFYPAGAWDQATKSSMIRALEGRNSFAVFLHAIEGSAGTLQRAPMGVVQISGPPSMALLNLGAHTEDAHKKDAQGLDQESCWFDAALPEWGDSDTYTTAQRMAALVVLRHSTSSTITLYTPRWTLEHEAAFRGAMRVKAMDRWKRLIIMQNERASPLVMERSHEGKDDLTITITVIEDSLARDRKHILRFHNDQTSLLKSLADQHAKESALIICSERLTPLFVRYLVGASPESMMPFLKVLDISALFHCVHKHLVSWSPAATNRTIREVGAQVTELADALCPPDAISAEDLNITVAPVPCEVLHVDPDMEEIVETNLWKKAGDLPKLGNAAFVELSAWYKDFDSREQLERLRTCIYQLPARLKECQSAKSSDIFLLSISL